MPKTTKKHPREKAATPRRKLYMKEWMEFLNVSDRDLASRLDTSETTVFRWYDQPRRLDPDKIIQVAEALFIEPADLFRPPGRPSIDGMLREASEKQHEDTADFVKRYILPPEGKKKEEKK